MLAKMLCVAATVATVGLVTPAFAGEGSPDIDRGSYGYYGSGPYYPYETESGFVMSEPADDNVGFRSSTEFESDVDDDDADE